MVCFEAPGFILFTLTSHKYSKKQPDASLKGNCFDFQTCSNSLEILLLSTEFSSIYKCHGFLFEFNFNH